MTFLTIRTRVKSIATIVGTTANITNLVKDSVQWALDQVSNSWSWPHLMEETFITTIAPHTTGNVNVTNGSKTVSGGATSPVFTAAMVGRKFRVSGQNAYYIIATFVSDTEITLEQAFQGDTDTDASYTIFKDEYRLPANLDKLKIMRQIENGVSMESLGASVFDTIEPTPQAQGTPRFNLITGSKRDIYNTGTVSASNNSNTITGASSPAWTTVDGLGNGTRLTIGTQVLTVKSVDSDTQITTYEKTTASISGGTTYELLMDNFIIQLFQIPNSAENIYFRFQRIAEPLVNDVDIPDIPDQYHHLLINGALSTVQKTKDKEEAQRELIIFFAGITEMKKRMGTISTNTVYRRRSITENFLRDFTTVRFPGQFGRTL